MPSEPILWKGWSRISRPETASSTKLGRRDNKINREILCVVGSLGFVWSHATRFWPLFGANLDPTVAESVEGHLESEAWPF